MSSSRFTWTPDMTLEDFSDKNEDELYAFYMESGACYEQDLEQFIEEFFDIIEANQPSVH